LASWSSITGCAKTPKSTQAAQQCRATNQWWERMNFGAEFIQEPNESFLILTTVPMTRGWTPINHLLKLSSTYFNCSVVHLDDKNLGPIDKLYAYFKSRKRVSGKPNVLVVVQTAAQLNQIFTISGWRSSFNFVAAWIIDSFHTEYLPRFSLRNILDKLFITSGADLDEYKDKSGVDTSILLWGSDVLGFGGGGAERKIDILRVGRQPPQWEDDEDNERSLSPYCLSYHGRPPDFGADSRAQKILMQEYMQKSKLALAYSNLVDRSHYTHTKKEYITARWLDAIACGCQVLGIPPRSDYAFDKLLWPSALIELAEPSRDNMLEAIQSAVESWTPSIADNNYKMALSTFDWRWRLLEIADVFELDRTSLHIDLEQIKALS